MVNMQRVDRYPQNNLRKETMINRLVRDRNGTFTREASGLSHINIWREFEDVHARESRVSGCMRACDRESGTP